MTLAGLMTVAGTGCTLATAVLVELKGGRLAGLTGGGAFGLKLLRLTQYVAVSLCCCTAVLEADIMQQASGTCVHR